MRRAFLLAALALVVPAQAVALPTASVPGVQVSREPSGSYRLLFTTAAYRPLAGRRITITCTSAVPRSPAAGPPRRGAAPPPPRPRRGRGPPPPRRGPAPALRQPLRRPAARQADVPAAGGRRRRVPAGRRRGGHRRTRRARPDLPRRRARRL